ncbi:MAG: TRAP transporter large permease subunit, partial [Stomatobaculum sp.]|nr:TRAP transporter large permease subunit [Stomatobaculum sp.]
MAFKVFCIVVTAYHLIFAAGLWTPRTLQHRSIHVAMMLILSFALYPATKKASRKTIAWYDYVLMALSAVTAIYMYVNYNTIVNRAGVVNGTDVIVGAILTVLVLEATRRVCGTALPVLSLIFILYALMGRRAGMIPINIPGIFLHRGYTLPKMFSNFYTNTEGIYGSSVNVASTYIFLFICFGEFMNKCGMGKFFNDIATALAGWSKSGPAKVAIIAAGLLGMINGAAVAVVVTTGS